MTHGRSPHYSERPEVARMTESAIAELALMGAALTLALLLVMRMLWARSRRRFDAMLDRVDDQLGAISESLRDAIDRSDGL